MISICRALLFLALVAAFSTSWADDYAVIVHPDNPISSSPPATIKEIRRLFLGVDSRWSSGILAIAISPPRSAESFIAFRTKILSMSQQELQAHWLQARNPPREVSSESLAAQLVARDLGSFGIVGHSRASKLKEKTRILFTF